MWNLKATVNFFTEQILTQTLKNLRFPNETVLGVGGCTEGLGWKSCEICSWWLLYNYKCNKIHWVIKKNKNAKKFCSQQVYSFHQEVSGAIHLAVITTSYSFSSVHIFPQGFFFTVIGSVTHFTALLFGYPALLHTGHYFLGYFLVLCSPFFRIFSGENGRKVNILRPCISETLILPHVDWMGIELQLEIISFLFIYLFILAFCIF